MGGVLCWLQFHPETNDLTDILWWFTRRITKQKNNKKNPLLSYYQIYDWPHDSNSIESWYKAVKLVLVKKINLISFIHFLSLNPFQYRGWRGHWTKSEGLHECSFKIKIIPTTSIENNWEFNQQLQSPCSTHINTHTQTREYANFRFAFNMNESFTRPTDLIGPILAYYVISVNNVWFLPKMCGMNKGLLT